MSTVSNSWSCPAKIFTRLFLLLFYFFREVKVVVCLNNRFFLYNTETGGSSAEPVKLDLSGLWAPDCLIAITIKQQTELSAANHCFLDYCYTP